MLQLSQKMPVQMRIATSVLILATGLAIQMLT